MVTNDVVEEILLRLLLKDLLRCKSVCKSWYSLISSPSFDKTYRKSMFNKEEYNTRRIAMLTGKKRAHSEWSSYMRWSMQGSSNGLVCMYSRYENRIIVTNPWTREFRELPPHLPLNFGHVRCLGFGYDSSTDDYKVFMATCTGNNGALVHIFSLKSNIWKFFGQINYEFNDRRFEEYDGGLTAPGILFNGALHWFWLNVDYTGNGKVLIVSFDLAKEEFREIPQPDDTRYVWNYDNSLSLGIIEGSLCIFTKNRYPPCSIWAMKNYNGKPSCELLPITNYREMKDHAIHYMLKDTNQYTRTLPPTYFCDDIIRLSRSDKYISSPIFVQTLVSPYVKVSSLYYVLVSPSVSMIYTCYISV